MIDIKIDVKIKCTRCFNEKYWYASCVKDEDCIGMPVRDNVYEIDIRCACCGSRKVILIDLDRAILKEVNKLNHARVEEELKREINNR